MCFAVKETPAQLNWSVCDFIIVHGQLWFPYLFVPHSCLWCLQSWSNGTESVLTLLTHPDSWWLVLANAYRTYFFFVDFLAHASCFCIFISLLPFFLKVDIASPGSDVTTQAWRVRGFLKFKLVGGAVICNQNQH